MRRQRASDSYVWAGGCAFRPIACAWRSLGVILTDGGRRWFPCLVYVKTPNIPHISVVVPRGMHRRLPAYGVGRGGCRWRLIQIKNFVPLSFYLRPPEEGGQLYIVLVLDLETVWAQTHILSAFGILTSVALVQRSTNHRKRLALINYLRPFLFQNTFRSNILQLNVRLYVSIAAWTASR